MTDSKHGCMCDIPCTVCGTLYFDDITLEERTDCEHIIPLPEWHEYLNDAQVAQMHTDTTDRRRDCSICRGFHGPEIQHACE